MTLFPSGSFRYAGTRKGCVRTFPPRLLSGEPPHGRRSRFAALSRILGVWTTQTQTPA